MASSQFHDTVTQDDWTTGHLKTPAKRSAHKELLDVPALKYAQTDRHPFITFVNDWKE